MKSIIIFQGQNVLSVISDTYFKMAQVIDFALRICVQQCFIEIEIDFKHNFCCKIN